jgi:hypothetical protein
MNDPDKVIKETVRRASAILAEYVQPGERNCEATVERLLNIFDNDNIVEALTESDELEHHNGGRQDEPRAAEQVPH